MTRSAPFLITLIALGGCATRYALKPLPPDHPAHPHAMEAPAAAASMTLAVNNPVHAAPAGGMQGSGGMQHGSGQMNHGAPSNASASRASEAAGHEGYRPAAAAPAAQTPATKSTASETLYVCPMHPKVVSTNPKDNCPECNMKINKPLKQAGETSTDAASPPGANNATHDHEHGGH